MPALVTLAPVQIDPVKYSRQFSIEINPMGPFLVGSNLYIVLQEQTSGEFVGVFKSTDSGATWANMDSAHRPSNNIGKNVFFDSATGLIHVSTVSLGGGGGWSVYTFDTGTDLWSAAGPLATPTGSKSAIYVKSDGTLVNLYEFADVERRTFAAGTWAAAASLIAGNNVQGALVDGSDNGHVLYNSGATLKYVLASPTYVAGSPVSLGTFDLGRPDFKFWGPNVVAAWTNTHSLVVAIGTPLSGAAFTNYTVATSALSDHLSYPTLAVDKDGNLVVFWVEIDYSQSPVVDRLWMSTFDGVSSWGAPVLFYDEITNPASNAIEKHTGNDTDQFIHTGDALQLADGTWIYATAMETWDPLPIGFQCTGFALIAGGGPAPDTGTLAVQFGLSGSTSYTPSTLALLCPILQSGTVGNPFTGQLRASGGKPPYTFSIIAGALPPGFTLDPVSGMITGTAAIVGTYSFTARVTDSLGATADSSACPITITICVSRQSPLVEPPPVDYLGDGGSCGPGEQPIRSQLP